MKWPKPCGQGLLLGLMLLCTLNSELSTARAQNTVFTYQGRVVDNGTNFDGTGQFQFALVTSTNANHTASATASISGGYVTVYTISNGGYGYVTAPAVTVAGGGGANAGGTANISGGAVTSVTVTNTGNGDYTSAPTVTIAPPPANISYTTYWSNDGTSVDGSEPSAALSVEVNNGFFTVVLGDTTQPNMTAIEAGLFNQPNLQLRIWFNDGVNGFAALSPVQTLTPEPYAIFANTASNLIHGLTIQQTAEGTPNVIGGSSANLVSSGVYGATISGGGATNIFGDALFNSVTSSFGTVSGGYENTANYCATVSGGSFNTAAAYFATVSGGSENTADANSATVSGGGDNAANGVQATVSGGYLNTANGVQATVGGGAENTASGTNATVSGGYENTARGAGAFVGGGGFDGGDNSGNNASGNASVVAGGLGNQATNLYATVPGGANNTAGGNYATVGGGNGNIATGGSGTVGGGSFNVAGGPNATVAGGAFNKAVGEYSFAAGQQAQALHPGAFVWGDSQNAVFASTANDQVSFRCAGGARFTSASGGADQTVSWTPGSGSWSFSSDRNLKDRFENVDASAVLDKVSQLPVVEWSYKGYPQRHIGAMAQDFHQLFPLNDNDKALNDADLHGVELAAIQGLNQKLEKENAELKAQNDSLAQRLANLAATVKALAERK